VKSTAEKQIGSGNILAAQIRDSLLQFLYVFLEMGSNEGQMLLPLL